MFKSLLLLPMLAFLAAPAYADPAKVKNVIVTKNGSGYTFDVTVSHGDTGWDDYVDAWRIRDTAGNVLGQRSLSHPHVNEQPFTRSLSGVKVPEGATSVIVEAHDTVTGWAPQGKTVQLP